MMEEKPADKKTMWKLQKKNWTEGGVQGRKGKRRWEDQKPLPARDEETKKFDTRLEASLRVGGISGTLWLLGKPKVNKKKGGKERSLTGEVNQERVREEGGIIQNGS